MQDSPGLRIQRIDTVEAFQKLEKAWQALFPHSGANSVFLTWEWLHTWWKTKGGGKQLWLLTAWEGGDLVGIAPLMLERQRFYGISLRVLRSLGGSDIDIGGFIVRQKAPRILAELCQALVRQAREWDLILLSQFPQEDPATQIILKTFKSLGLFRHTTTERHLYLPIAEISGGVKDGATAWAGYLGKLPGRFRRDVRKMIRRAERQGELKYARYVGSSVTQEHLATIYAINEHGRYPEMYRPLEERAFQHALLEKTCELGWPDLSLLYFNDQPVAFLYGFLFQQRFEAWRTGYDTAYFELAVGKIVLMRMLEDCFLHQYQEVDFLRGDEWYKNRLQVSERPYYWQIRLAPLTKPIPLVVAIGIPKLKAWLKARSRKGRPQEEAVNLLPSESGEQSESN